MMFSNRKDQVEVERADVKATQFASFLAAHLAPSAVGDHRKSPRNRPMSRRMPKIGNFAFVSSS